MTPPLPAYPPPCPSHPVPPHRTPSPAYHSEFGIVYCTVEGHPQTLNAFLPAPAAEPAPALVDIHGGWWMGGGPATSVSTTFTDKGIAVFSISYRLGREGGFPQNIRDCRNAIRFIRQHAAQFHIDPDRIAVMGGSAGGYLSLLCALAPEDLADGGPTEGLQGVSARVCGAFGFIAPTDFIRFWDQGPEDVVKGQDGQPQFRAPDDKIPDDSRPRLRLLFHGLTPDSESGRALYKKMSLTNYVRKNIPPLLIADGEKDPIVPGLHGKVLYEKLKGAGADVTYWMTPGGGHGFPSGKGFDELLDHFLDRCLHIAPAGDRPVTYPYKDPQLPLDDRIEDLLARMNPVEKIRQLDMYWGKEVANMNGHEAASNADEKLAASLGNTGIGSVHDFYPLSAVLANHIQQYALEKTRLGIPVLFIEEGLHGYSGLGSTTFPIPLELSAAWDTALVHDIGHVIATETRAHGVDMILGPVLCLPRDPRWGRVEETYGEDPYLAARNGVAMVKGMQGGDVSRPDAVVSEPKHFAVHGIPEAGSNTSPVNMGEREARSSFLYVFEKAVREGGALAMMAAYSELDGIPCVDNKWLLTDVLRREWGFKGFVLSDLGAIKMSLENHQVAADTADALAQTLKAGLDMQFYDFPHDAFLRALTRDLDSNALSMKELNRAVRDVLRVKFLLGLFDHPYTDTALTGHVFHTPESQQLALRAAREGIVLLKNETGLLPLRPAIRSLAVIGPLAASRYLGGYSNEAGKAVSILDGLRDRAGNDLTIRYEKGYAPDSAGPELLQRALDLVRHSDAAVVALGEDARVIGEGKDRAHLDLDSQQVQLIRAIRETGKPVVVVLCNGRPICINWVAANIPAIVETWFSGEQGGLAIADVLLGRTNPSGKLPMTFPRSVGQIPFYYNQKPTSRHSYVDEANTPLFPFGHGLSYTTFSYSDLQISPAVIPVDGETTIRITVKNTGTVAGEEVTQLYIRDVIGSVTTPEKSLRGFGRVALQPGESKVLEFTLGPDALSLWNREMKRVVEPGEFRIMVGSSSSDLRQTGSLWVK